MLRSIVVAMYYRLQRFLFPVMSCRPVIDCRRVTHDIPYIWTNTSVVIHERKKSLDTNRARAGDWGSCREHASDLSHPKSEFFAKGGAKCRLEHELKALPRAVRIRSRLLHYYDIIEHSRPLCVRATRVGTPGSVTCCQIESAPVQRDQLSRPHTTLSYLTKS